MDTGNTENNTENEIGQSLALAQEPMPEPVLSEAVLRKAKRVLDKADSQSKRDKQLYDKFVKYYKDGILKTLEGKADWCSANQVFPYVNVLLSLLYHQNPQVAVTPRLESGANEAAATLLTQRGIVQSPDEARKIFAETLQNVLTYSYDEGRSEISNNAALFETLVRGLGWSKSSFDPIRGIDRCDALRRDEVFCDPHGRCDVAQCRYIVQTCVKPVEEAEELFKALGYQNEIKANYQMVEDEGLTGQQAKKNDPSEAKDCFKFFEYWSKDSEVTQFGAYESNRWVDYFDGVTKAHLFRRPWPFILDYDEFPYEDLAMNRQYTQVCDAFPDLQVVESLWKLYEYLIEYFHRHVKRSIAKKWIYDRSVFTDDDIDKLKNPVDMEFVGANKVENRNIESLFQLVDFNSSSDTPAELAKTVKIIAESILGLDEIQKGGIQSQKEITATHAEILDEYGRLRLGRRQKIVDEWLTRQCRHRAQIARQLVSVEKVQQIAGSKAAEVWAAMSYDPADLVGEYSIGIIAGSAGERAKRAKVQMMDGILNRMAQINQSEGRKVFDLVSFTREIIRAEGEKKPEQYEIPQGPEPVQQPESRFNINGASVEGLFSLVSPQAPGAVPLVAWEEARNMVAQAMGVPPEQLTEEMARQRMPQTPAPQPQETQNAKPFGM